MPDIHTPEDDPVVTDSAMAFYRELFRHDGTKWPAMIAARDAAIRREEPEAVTKKINALEHIAVIYRRHDGSKPTVKYLQDFAREAAGLDSDAIRAREPGAVGSSTTPATEVTDV